MLRTHPRAVTAILASTLGSISLITGIYGTTMLVKGVSALTGLASIGTSFTLVPPQSTAAVADTLSMVERGLARGPGEPLNTPIANPSIEQAVEGDAESASSMTTANEDIVVSTAHAIGIRSSVTRPTLRRPQSHLTSASAVPTIIQPTDAMAPHNSSSRLSRMFTTLEVDLTLTRLQASIPAPIIDPEDNIKNFVAVAPAGGLKCLLVENNLISLKILERLLSRIGCTCALAYDGAEAIVAALGGSKFDFILMDLSMPRVDGGTAAKYIRRVPNCNQTTPIIAVSAYHMSESEISDSVFDASLPKPVRKESLSALLSGMGYQVGESRAPRLKNSQP